MARRTDVKWQHPGLEFVAGYPGAFYPALVLNKVIAAGGVISAADITIGEKRRLIRCYGSMVSCSAGKVEVTAAGWKQLGQYAQKAQAVKEFGWDQMVIMSKAGSFV